MTGPAPSVSEQSVAEPPARPSRWRGAGRDVAVVLGCFLVTGVVCGVLWWLAVEPAAFTKVEDQGSMGELELAKRFNADGWYVVIGTLAGLVAGVVLTAWRSRDFLLSTILVWLGAVLAAAAMAVTGSTLGPGETDAALSTAAPGAQVPLMLTVTASAAYLVWPMAALIGSLVVLWSPPQSSAD